MKAYTFVDYSTQAYLAIVGVLILLFHGQTVLHWQWLVALHLVALGLIHLIISLNTQYPAGRALDFLRHFYPVLLYAGLFAETGRLNQMFVQGFMDPIVIEWDQALFGCQPSLIFMHKMPFLWLSEILYAAYFSYYLMIGGVGFILYLGNRQHFFHYVSVVSFVFYLCYLMYLFLPIIGPPVFFREIPGYNLPPNLQLLAPPGGYPQTIQSGWFYQLVRWIYRVFEAPGAAIPSSHVAVSLCTVFFSFRYIRPIRWFHLILAVLLCVATVYCRYHYVCDVLAGLLTAALLIPLGNWLYFRFSQSPR